MDTKGGLRKCVQYIYWAGVKTQAVNANLLGKLWCEADLCPGKDRLGADLCSTYCEDLLSCLRDVRVSANKSATDNTGMTIKAELRKSLSNWQLTDAFFDIEAEFFRSMMGEKGTDIVMAKLRSFFSIEGVARPVLANAAQQCNDLCESKLFAFSPAGVQNEVVSFNKVVQAMLLGSAPVCKPNSTEVNQLMFKHVFVFCFGGCGGQGSARKVCGFGCVGGVWCWCVRCECLMLVLGGW